MRFIVLWDHHGAGTKDPREAEANVCEAFERVGVARDRVLAVSFEPEFEIVLGAVWERVLEALAQKRGERRLAAALLPHDPKNSVAAAARAHRLRVDSGLFEGLAGLLSIERLKKGEALEKVAAFLVTHFGAKTAGAAGAV